MPYANTPFLGLALVLGVTTSLVQAQSTPRAQVNTGLSVQGYSSTGVMTPNAYTLPSGAIGLSYDRQMPGAPDPDGYNIQMGFGLLDNLEMVGRLATNDLNCDMFESGACPPAIIRDFSGSLKWQLPMPASWSGLPKLADSVLSKRLSFDLSRQDSTGSLDLLRALRNGGGSRLDSAALIRLGTYHLNGSAFSNLDMRADSVRITNGSESRVAWIGFETERPLAGQRIRVEVTVSASGALIRMAPSFEAAQPITDTFSRALQAIKVGFYILLALGFIVVFLRRLSGRLLDLKAALVDAMIIGVLGGVVAATSTTFLADIFSYAPLWAEFLFRLIVFSIVSGAVSIFVFMLAGVTDSVVRERHEGKLGALVLLRHGDFQNKLVGSVLVRGVALGGILLGLGVGSLALFDHLHLDLGPDFISNATFRPVISSVFGGLETAYFLTLLWVVGVSSVVQHLSERPVVSVFLLTLTGAFLGTGPVTFETQSLGLL
ncbi:MAG: hypothetical protein ACO326_09185, partial [Burkholderiaceae bacterium]